METAQLQLIFNVVAITGVSSLASFCYLLRKENRKLANSLTGETKQEESRNQAEVAQAAVTSTEKDIRTFAADQRARWVDGMRLSATLWSAPGK
jgi:hypothetical protein